MLVLSRTEREKIVLHGPDGAILGIISVEEIRGMKVRLGFEFPKEISILRSEVTPTQGQVPLSNKGKFPCK